jgi:hypothetical protein
LRTTDRVSRDGVLGPGARLATAGGRMDALVIDAEFLAERIVSLQP